MRLPDPLPIQVAAETINANIRRINATLRAVGSVDGHVTVPDKGRRTYHLDGVLFYLAPQYFRFVLKSFGDTQILIGSNAEHYWCFSKTDEQFVCGRHGREEELPEGIPARPDQLIDALGLTPVPSIDGHGGTDGAGDRLPARLVQRVVEASQELLFIVAEPSGTLRIEKEYWIDRYPPHLVRRVVFRDADGVEEMISALDDYRRLGNDGPLVAHLMTAEWPKLGAKMRFDVRQWTTVPQVSAGGVQFATPEECRP